MNAKLAGHTASNRAGFNFLSRSKGFMPEPWLRSLRTMRSISALLVTIAPPSPNVPRFF